MPAGQRGKKVATRGRNQQGCGSGSDPRKTMDPSGLRIRILPSKNNGSARIADPDGLHPDPNLENNGSARIADLDGLHPDPDGLHPDPNLENNGSARIAGPDGLHQDPDPTLEKMVSSGLLIRFRPLKTMDPQGLLTSPGSEPRKQWIRQDCGSGWTSPGFDPRKQWICQNFGSRWTSTGFYHRKQWIRQDCGSR